jgi:hypothetical protein
LQLSRRIRVSRTRDGGAAERFDDGGMDFGGGECIAGCNVGEAYKRMHQRKLTRVIELEAGNALSGRCDGRFRELSQLDPHFIIILTGRNLPKIRHQREPEPSIINEKTVADFTRVVEQTGILEREPSSPAMTQRSPPVRLCPGGWQETNPEGW